MVILYADDNEYMSETNNGLQNQLNCLKKKSEEKKLQENADKTKHFCKIVMKLKLSKNF